ncbi:MAG: mannose-1-phosphate guanylyltransferase [Pirellulales bacterium]
MLHAVIMAGGAGTRFWPASRVDQPKQLLRLVGERTMIQSTVDRLGDVVPPDRVLVVTNRRLVAPIRSQLPEIPSAQVLGEPCKRDTAPCIGLAAGLLARQDPQATMVVMPSDHVINTSAQFQQAIRSAAELVERNPQRLVTFGIKPTYPAEVFGYIERGAPLLEAASGLPSFKVSQFREKPRAEVARQYVDSGNFYWNAGIFVWKAQTILDLLDQHEPQMAQRLATIVRHAGAADFDAVFEREFAAIDGKSIDFAVMEKASEVAVIEAPFTWDDLGGWGALPRLLGRDADGNTIDGPAVLVGARDCVVRSEPGHLVAALGVEGLIIVHTPQATLVARQEDEEKIRQIVQRLEQTGQSEFL